MYLQEALELVCRKRRMDPKDYALLLGDMSLLIPLDRTVASLQGKRELVLIKRSMLPEFGIDIFKGTLKTTDPNGANSSLCHAACYSHPNKRQFSNACLKFRTPNLRHSTTLLRIRYYASICS